MTWLIYVVYAPWIFFIQTPCSKSKRYALKKLQRKSEKTTIRSDEIRTQGCWLESPNASSSLCSHSFTPIWKKGFLSSGDTKNLASYFFYCPEDTCFEKVAGDRFHLRRLSGNPFMPMMEMILWQQQPKISAWASNDDNSCCCCCCCCCWFFALLFLPIVKKEKNWHDEDHWLPQLLICCCCYCYYSYVCWCLLIVYDVNIKI